MHIQDDDEEDKMSEIKKKPYAPRQHRVVEDDNEVVIEKALSPVNETTKVPPTIMFGKTSDKYTNFWVSDRGQ